MNNTEDKDPLNDIGQAFNRMVNQLHPSCLHSESTSKGILRSGIQLDIMSLIISTSFSLDMLKQIHHAQLTLDIILLRNTRP